MQDSGDGEKQAEARNDGKEAGWDWRSLSCVMVACDTGKVLLVFVKCGVGE